MPINLKLKNFLRVLIPFALTQATGIYVAYRFLPEATSLRPIDSGTFSVVDVIVLIIFVLIFFLFANKFKKAGSVFYKVFLSLVVFSGVQTVFGVWLNPSISTVLSLAVIVIFWLFQNVIIQNITMILSIAGIGSLLGLSLLPMTVIYLLIVFSFYDIISVYKTGHMIKLAQAMIQSRAIFGFIIPESGGSLRKHVSGVVPGEGFMILGSGDVIFPLILAASAVRISLADSIIVGIFSVAGLFLMHLIFNNQKVRRPMAALPPIVLMSIIGYLVANLI